jgi:hypothetical protein
VSLPKFGDQKKDEAGAENGHDESGRMEERAILRLGEKPSYESAHDGTNNAQKGCSDETHVARAHKPLRKQTGEESDDDVPDNMEHDVFPFLLAVDLRTE